MANKRKKKSWWQTVKFKYRLTVVNENTLEEVVSLSVSKLNGLSVLLTVIGTLILLTALLLIYTPLRNYLPGYMSNELRAQIVENSLLTDSLKQAVDRQRFYIMSVQDVMAGRVSADSVGSIDSLAEMRIQDLMTATERERQFTEQYEKDERYNLTNYIPQADADGLDFFRPVRGMISATFNRENGHPGVDIAANPNESVLAALDGTVVWNAYAPQTGYTVAVQHRNDWITIYKNCGSLLKREGQQVRAGEVIAVVGNKEKASGPHLHFELWHKGQALDPEKYIVF